MTGSPHGWRAVAADTGRAMSNSLVEAVAGAYRAPRAAIARELGRGVSEPRSLFYLMLASAVFFVASMPNAVRESQRLDVDDALQAAISAHLFGYLAMAPLLAYAFAALVHFVARAFGGVADFGATRLAVFWAMLLGAPIALALSLLGMFAEIAAGPRRLPWLELVGYAGLAFWLWLFAASIAEAEGFASTGRVAAVLVGAFAAIAGLLAVLAGGPGMAG